MSSAENTESEIAGARKQGAVTMWRLYQVLRQHGASERVIDQALCAVVDDFAHAHLVAISAEYQPGDPA